MYCLTNECIVAVSKGLARAFPDRTNKESWCIPKDIHNTTTTTTTTTTSAIKKKKKHQGLILVKVPKAASSTSAGVVLRLGHRHHCDLDYVHWVHQHAHKEYAYRDPSRSFMLMSVRDPAKQLTSYVSWTHVSLRKIPTEQVNDGYLVSKFYNFGSKLGHIRHFQGGLQSQFASLEEIPEGVAWDPKTEDLTNPHDIIARVESILDGYDFILVVERMDESLVALSLLLDIPIGDVLVSSSKVSAPTRGENGKKEPSSYVYHEELKECLPMRQVKLTPLLKGYLDSDYFRSLVYGDLVLHAAANHSLDLTIERLGVERFQKALKEYHYWKQKERQDCSTKVAYPCSCEGVPQLEKAETNCYARDLGCGHQCIDKMLASDKGSWWWFW